MVRGLLLPILLFCASDACAQDTTKIWRFGQYSYRSGFCDGNTATAILRGTDTLQYHCGGDPVTFLFVDTISLNNDNMPDFAYTYVDEYYVIGLAVSQPGGGYKDIDVTDLFEFQPSVYHTTIPANATVIPMVLRDVDGDGRRDMVIGGLDRKKNYTIKGYTQIVPYPKLRQIAGGKTQQKKASQGKVR